MRFWDASAITPLLVSESRSDDAAELLRADRQMVAWWGTRVECVSALRCREREGKIDAAGVGAAIGLLDALSGSWSEVQPSSAVRAGAERALAVHALRAADATQLAAAVVWRGDSLASAEFACFDERLADAAAREGFTVVPST